ncbi:MATE family efflux transporter [Candidatus Chloroploca asiatica]|uniref:Probable multidrug resistance protein NorM n=1 Tax=Candidatus Chloroploca asiatica TaxID=1506545 RepID=A0A2H3L401_9CHLR|nr:MATE family efflux transporter [Candidatus Chloroploca asiatica]PDV97870.1 MATE family efflux transporter [Candidatus Chloroploca asiatica]
MIVSREQKGIRRRVFDLAVPVIGENLLQTLMGVVDTLLVAGLGVAALAGVGASLQVIFVLLAAMSALAVGASVLVAQAVGAGNLVEASRVARQTLIWSVVIAVPLSLLGLLLSPVLMGLFGLEPEVAAIGTEYLMVTMGALATLTIMLLASAVLRGAGDTQTPMQVTALANLVNLVLTWALIYGHLGMPELGAVGSAWGTVLSRGMGAILLVLVLVRGRNGVKVGGAGSWRPERKAFGSVMHIGLPAALEEVLVITALAALTPIVAMLGTVDLAAHRIAFNILSLSFLPGLGFGLAATALVGQAVGAGRIDEAQAYTRVALRWAVLWMSGLGLLFIFFAAPLIRLFNDDPTLVASGSGAIIAVALTQPLWAATFVYAGALRGTGDTRTPLIITGILNWLAVVIALVGVWLVPALWVVWAAFLISGPIETYFLWRAWRSVVRAWERTG